jgi:hypothetical protein
LPGFGLCKPETSWDGEPVTIGIGCLAPVRQPDLTYVTALWSDNCRAQQSSSPQTISGFGWTGSLDSAPADFSLTGVWSVPVNLTNSFSVSDENEGRRVHMRQLCPGMPLNFTTYTLGTRTRLEISIPNFRLPEIANNAKVTIQAH